MTTNQPPFCPISKHSSPSQTALGVGPSRCPGWRGGAIRESHAHNVAPPPPRPRSSRDARQSPCKGRERGRGKSGLGIAFLCFYLSSIRGSRFSRWLDRADPGKYPPEEYGLFQYRLKGRGAQPARLRTGPPANQLALASQRGPLTPSCSFLGLL